MHIELNKQLPPEYTWTVYSWSKPTVRRKTQRKTDTVEGRGAAWHILHTEDRRQDQYLHNFSPAKASFAQFIPAKGLGLASVYSLVTQTTQHNGRAQSYENSLRIDTRKRMEVSLVIFMTAAKVQSQMFIDVMERISTGDIKIFRYPCLATNCKSQQGKTWHS